MKLSSNYKNVEVVFHLKIIEVIFHLKQNGGKVVYQKSSSSVAWNCRIRHHIRCGGGGGFFTDYNTRPTNVFLSCFVLLVGLWQYEHCRILAIYYNFTTL
jgi:hypothetical protein